MNAVSHRWRAAAVALAAYSLLATIALAWMIGHATAPTTRVTQPELPKVTTPPSAAPLPTPTPKPEPQYPIYQSEIPAAFRGSWDEITSDRCYGREPRFYLGTRQFMNFEVEWEVTKVKLYSPTEIDIHTTAYDDNKNQVDEVWEFKLADGGSSLTSRKPGGTFFKKCPKPV